MSTSDDIVSVIRTHFDEHRSVAASVEGLSTEIAGLAASVLATLRSGGTLFFAGNGGSAADAQHLAAEYVVRFQRERNPAAAIALTVDTSILTAGGNDYGFETVFERQVRALARPGDMLVLHSTSGESENLLLAATAAAEQRVTTAALLAKGGGRLAHMVDRALVVETSSTARAQEMHLFIGHIVCDIVDIALTADLGS
jgi:D-sedoheptulose 7-phosphate isomerase